MVEMSGIHQKVLILLCKNIWKITIGIFKYILLGGRALI